MAAFVLKDAELRFSDNDISGISNSLNLNYSAALPDNTVFGDDTRSRVSGLREASANVNCFFDDATATLHSDFFDQIGAASDVPLSITPVAAAAGGNVFFFSVHQATWNPGGQIGDLFQFSGEFMSNAPLVGGTILNTAAITATSNSTGYQLGALADTSEYMYALLQITAAPGSPTLDVIIESDDDGTFGAGTTTRITFSQVTTSTVGVIMSVQGPITDAYWRASWTVGGTGANYSNLIGLGKVTI